MKELNNFIQEKLKVNAKLKIDKNEPLEPDEVKGPETPGKDYFDDEVIIIGWPFQKINDDNYTKTKEYIKRNHYYVYNDYGEIEDPESWDWFCYAQHPEDGDELNCYVYAEEGVLAYGEK